MTCSTERTAAIPRSALLAAWAREAMAPGQMAFGPSALLRGRLRLERRLGRMEPGEYPVMVKVERNGVLGAGIHLVGLRVTTPGGVQDLQLRACVNGRWGRHLVRVSRAALSGSYSTPQAYTLEDERRAVLLVATAPREATVEELGLEVVGGVVLELGTTGRSGERRSGTLTLEEYLGSGKHLQLDERNDGGGLERAPGALTRIGRGAARGARRLVPSRRGRRARGETQAPVVPAAPSTDFQPQRTTVLH